MKEPNVSDTIRQLTKIGINKDYGLQGVAILIRIAHGAVIVVGTLDARSQAG